MTNLPLSALTQSDTALTFSQSDIYPCGSKLMDHHLKCHKRLVDTTISGS